MIEFESLAREPVYWCLVGSHNYNLNTEDSDTDYKVFVAPTFKDLYDGSQYSKSHTGVDLDYSVHDIRKLPRLLWKSNLNFIEALFSEELKICHIGSENTVEMIMGNILNRRDSLARMNLPYLWNACIGMYFNKFKLLEKGTEGTQCLVERYGYDTKQAQHCYRCLDFLERYCARDFMHFKSAITYEDGPDRDLMMEIRQGSFPLKDFEMLVEDKRNHTQKFEEAYKMMPDDALCDWLNSRIEELVKYAIIGH